MSKWYVTPKVVGVVTGDIYMKSKAITPAEARLDSADPEYMCAGIVGELQKRAIDSWKQLLISEGWHELNES